jgi:hypothetical protein
VIKQNGRLGIETEVLIMWNYVGVSMCSQSQFTQNPWRSEELLDAGIRTASEQCRKEEAKKNCRGIFAGTSLRVNETGRFMTKCGKTAMNNEKSEIHPMGEGNSAKTSVPCFSD